MDDENTPVAFTVPGCELQRVLANALLFACKDTTLPSICVVRIVVEAGTVHAVATDKYILSREVLPVWKDSTIEGDGEFSLGRDKAQMLIKNPELDSPFIPVVIGWDGGEKIEISAGDAGMWKFATAYGQYAKWQELWADRPAASTGRLIIDLHHVQRFAKVRTGDKHADKSPRIDLVFQTGSQWKLGAMRGRIGDSFEARWMPIRYAEEPADEPAIEPAA